MRQAKTNLIKLWQWPNVLALDTALIAVLWQVALAGAVGAELGGAAYVVLGLSVWLAYVADRLYDVKSRDAAALLSIRHQFAKRHVRRLWRVWFAMLGLNLLVATQLTGAQLKHGALLLAVCFVYTLLNQKLSRRFFPKEICVALIYAGGVVVFLPEAVSVGFFAAFAFLCLLDCLMIGAKEITIDAGMRVHSVAPMVSERYLTPLAWIGAGLSLWNGLELWLGLALSFALIGALHGLRNRIEVESFRVLVDAALVAGVLLVL